MTEHSVFFCIGRKSEIMKSGSMNVTQSILEVVTICCPGVALAASIPVSHASRFQVVCACIILQSDSKLTEKNLRRYCEYVHADNPDFSLIYELTIWASSCENLSSGFAVREDSNRTAQLHVQRLSRVLIFFNLANIGIILSRQRTTKALIRLRGCAGWSAPLLFAYGINRFSHDVAQMSSEKLPQTYSRKLEKKELTRVAEEECGPK